MSSKPAPPTEFAATEAVLTQALADYKAALESDGLPAPHLTDAKPTVFDDRDFVPSPALGQATQTLVSSLNKMTHLVQSSIERYRLLSLWHWHNRAIVLMEQQKIADILAEAGEKGMSVAELGPKVNVHPERLLTLLRLLANDDIFVEVKEGVFANNRTSLAITTDFACRTSITHLGAFSYVAIADMPKQWSDPRNYNEGDDLHTLWSEHFGYTGKMTYWQHLANNGLSANFAKMMGSIPTASLAAADWPALVGNSGDATLIDLGAGRGDSLKAILSLHDKLKGIVFDLPQVQQAYEEYWAGSAPLKESRVTFEAGNYFDAQPEARRKAQGYHYFIRAISHDLNDEKLLVLLRNIAAAMHPSSKLFIVDQIMKPATPQPIGTAGVPLETLPGPLLASGGLPRMMAHLLNCEMHASFNAKERSQRELEELYAKVGLRLVKILYFTASWPMQVVELKA